MRTSKSSFSNIICILFSIYLVCLLDLFVNKRLEIGNWVSNAIITGGVCAIVVGLAFLLNKYISGIYKKLSFDEDKFFWILFGIVSFIFVAIRILIIADVIVVEKNLTDITNNAMIKDGVIFFDLTTTDGIFTTILSVFFKVFGNTFVPVYLTQFILSLAAYLFLIFGLKNLFGKFVAIVSALFLAAFPGVFRTLACDSSVNLIFLFFAIIVFITAKYRKNLEIKDFSLIKSLLIGLVCGVAGLYHLFFLYIVIIPLVVIMEVDTEGFSARLLNMLMVVLGTILGFVLPLVFEAFVFNKTGALGFVDSFVSNVLYRFGLKYDFDVLANYVSEIHVFVLLSLCIIYVVMYWVNDSDDMHVLCAMLLAMLLQIACNNIVNNDAFMMCINICLVAIAAYGIKSLTFERETYRIVKSEDDMQPVVIESISNKAINISSGASVNDAAKRVAEKFEDINDSDYKKDEPESVAAQEVNFDPYEVVDESNNETYKNESVQEAVKEIEYEAVFVADSIKNETEESISTSDELKNEIDEETISKDETLTTEEDVTEAEIVKDTVDEEISTDDVYVSKLKDEFDTLGADSLITTPSQDLIDFERLFTTGITNLPPGVKLEVEEEQIEDLSDNDEDAETLIETDDTVIEEPKETQGSVMANQFFDYLFKEIPDPEPIVDEKPTESFADKVSRYADLDIDLGTDAFNYMPVTDSEEAFNSNNSADTDEPSVEEMLTQKIVDEELVEAENNLSIEDIVETKILVDDAINEKEEELALINAEPVDERSIEDIINEKLDIEENTSIQELIEEQLDIEDNTSIQFELEKKLEKEANVSFEDIINDKLDFEEWIEAKDEAENVVENKIDIFEPLVKNIETDTFTVTDDNPISLEEVTIISDEFNFQDENISKNDFSNDYNEKIIDEDSNQIDDKIDEIYNKAIVDGFHFETENKETLNVDLESNNSEFIQTVSEIENKAEEEIFFEGEVRESEAFSEKEETFVEETLAEETFVEETFVEETFVEDTFVEDTFVEETFVEDTLVEDTLVEETLVEKTVAEETHAEETLVEELFISEPLDSSKEDVFIDEEIKKTELIVDTDNEPVTESIINSMDDVFFEDADNNFDSVADAEETIVEWDNFVDVSGVSDLGSIEEEINNIEEIDGLTKGGSFGEEKAFYEELKAIENGSFEELFFDNAVIEDVESDIKVTEEARVSDFVSKTENQDILKDDYNELEHSEADSNKEIDGNEKEEKTIEYIENPLPLPKKHVHRDMDYGRSIPDVWMHYDVEINSSNDFYDY